jgi:TetR/AcrR family transcriptional regulator, transcriptional repressor for nem operon
MSVAKGETRLSLLDTARRIVLAKGYAAVGINEVLAEAGVPKGRSTTTSTPKTPSARR